jgi:hypothetical protein
MDIVVGLKVNRQSDGAVAVAILRRVSCNGGQTLVCLDIGLRIE